MSTSRLIKNTGFLSLAYTLQPVISYFLIVAISHSWSKEGFGEYSTIFAYISVFQVISAFGLKTLIPREVTRDPQAGRKLVLHGAAIVLPFAFVSMIVMSLWIILMDFPQAVTRAGVILSLSLIPAALIECFEGAIIGYQRMQWIAIVYTVENVLRVGVSLFFIHLGFGLVSIVWIFIVSKFIAFGLFLRVLLRMMPHSEESGFDKMFYRRFIRMASPFVLITFFVMMYWNIDKILLPKLTDMASNGIYNAAYKFFWLVMLLISSFVTSLFPIISGLYHTDTMAFERVCFKAIRYFIIVAVPCTLGLFFLSGPIITIIYGPDYQKAVPVLKILCWALVPFGISEILAYAFLASNYQKIDLGINAAGMVIMAGLNWWLIRWLGYPGAAWAVLSANMIYLAMQLPFISGRVLKKQPDGFRSDLMKIALTAILSILIWRILLPIHWAIAAGIGLAAFPVFLIFVFKVFNAEDALLFKRICGRLRPIFSGPAGSENL